MRKGFRQFVAGVDLNSITPDGALCRAGQADLSPKPALMEASIYTLEGLLSAVVFEKP